MNAHEPISTGAMIARCRLSEARKWFKNRGSEILPQTERGWRILKWGADQAWMCSTTPQLSVKRWANRWAPWLTKEQLNDLIKRTKTSNKRWSADQCAVVLEISVTERAELRFRHLGANDDPEYRIRDEIKRAKSAERSRRWRAARSTGAKRGRPSLQLSTEESLARRRAQDAERAKRYRASRKNASRQLSKIRWRDGITPQSVVARPRFICRLVPAFW